MLDVREAGLMDKHHKKRLRAASHEVAELLPLAQRIQALRKAVSHAQG